MQLEPNKRFRISAQSPAPFNHQERKRGWQHGMWLMVRPNYSFELAVMQVASTLAFRRAAGPIHLLPGS